jgi:hypothetical protein
MSATPSLDLRPSAEEIAPRRVVPALAGLASLVFAVVAAVWLAVPSTNPFADPDSVLSPQYTLVGAASPAVAAAALLAACVVGVAVAGYAVAGRNGRSHRRANAVTGGFGIAFTVTVGAGLLSASALSIAGYLTALLIVVGAAIVGTQVVRIWRIGRWTVGAIAAALVAVFATGVLPVEALGVLGRNIAGMAGELASIAVVLGLTVAVLLWALVAGTAMRDAGMLDRLGRWVLRHRRAITIIAALGPAPYAVLRLTWLTPWPYGFINTELPPDARIWGLLLSAGAWAGIVLTIGLIRPWGEVFPRWMPFAAGQPVPVWVAAVPGATVAAILCVSAVPMIRMFAEQSLADALQSALIFPCWLWGPALALAVWGYVLHRRSVPRFTNRPRNLA